MKENRALADWAASLRPEQIPAGVRSEASKALLNVLGAALGAARHETIDVMLRAIEPFKGPEQAQVIGRSKRLDVLNASLLNGTMAHVLDYDDTDLRTVLHPSSPVFPVVLALGESMDLPGERTATAFVLGTEVAGRVALCICPSHYEAGWHVTGTAGVFGAAAAAGYLLGLDGTRMAWALGLASSQAGGLREMFGTMTKPFHPGRAAQSGLLAALLAREGFTSSEEAIEGRRGYGKVAATGADFGALTANLGSDWVLQYNSYKPYACGVVSHPLIDGMIKMRKNGLTPEKVSEVRITVNGLVPELMGKKEPRTGLEGKFSAYHCAAVGLIDGKAGPAQFTDERVNAEEVVRLRDKVTLNVGEVAEDEAYIEVRTNEGVVESVHVEHALGSRDNPMSFRDVEEKFFDLAGGVIGRRKAGAVVEMCRDWWSLHDTGKFAEYLEAGA